MPTRLYYLLLIIITSSFKSKAQQMISVPQENGTTKEVLLLPYYPINIDTSLKEIKSVKVGLSSKRPRDFKSQITEAASQTAQAGGNVFQISSMQDHKQSDAYKISGTAYHADNYEAIKLQAIAHKKKSTGNRQYAIITLYRPVYNSSFNDDIALELTINDTLHLQLKGNTKYLVKVAKDCEVRIATAGKSMVQRLNVRAGNNYYVRAYTNFPGSGKQVKAGDMMIYLKTYQPYFEFMDELQGNLESSLVNNIVISKTL